MGASELDWVQVEELFHAALDLAPSDRAGFLDEACGGDAELRREVDDLLAADDDAETFLTESDRVAAAMPLFAGELPRRLGAYRLLEVQGEGGMGVVYRAERADGAFEQRVAIKMLRPGPTTSGLLARFDAERRTLARLEHPDIARLLDAGEDENGAPWLAMEFVEGRPIDAWCDARSADVRARVELVARICDAVAHAHDQLVVHRDLKPANALVDESGRPRLLDFGIAKVIDDEAEGLDLTQADQRVMTPAYAAPEQLRGEAVGVRTDVYALGVLLYELISGARPHGDSGTSRFELERSVLERDPAPPSESLVRAEDASTLAAARGTDVRSLQRVLARDLDRICLMALRREPERRYASAAELADELRRWLGGLPVRARGDGLGYRLSTFVRRRPIETGLAAAATIAALSGVGVFVDASFRDRDRLAEIQRLGDVERLDELRASAATLWPIGPAQVEPLKDWIARADTLLGRRDLHGATLERWRAEDASGADAGWDSLRVQLLEELVDDLAALGVDDRFAPTRDALAWRLERSRSLAQRSIHDHREAWDASLARLADDPRFAGLALEPQLGLVPLGPDPDGGLEAFWAVDTGDRPTRDADGRIVASGSSGLVLLLVPGGETRIGSQADDPDAPRFDPDTAAATSEGPPQSVVLDPYLISKFEVTQGQWLHWTGDNPSDYDHGGNSTVGGRSFGPTNPVERASYDQARETLAHYDLDLPTEAQWEHATRAGTDSIRPTGDELESLAGYANFADRYAAENGGAAQWKYVDWVDDGHTVHAPVGSYTPNAFGLHDTLGNVWEWTRDRYHDSTVPPRNGDGLRTTADDLPADHPITARGGCYYSAASQLRSSLRYRTSPTLESRSTGIRPAGAWGRQRGL